MGGIFIRIAAWWQNTDPGRRIVTVIGIGFLAVLAIGTYMIASKPRMALLYGGLSDAEQGMIVTEVQKMGVQADIDMKGNVLVPSDKVAELRARLAMSGKTPAGGHLDYGSLNDLGMMKSNKVEQEQIKAIIEGELAKSIEFMDGVQSAKVHITLGDNSPFANEAKPATASVTIHEQIQGSLGPEQGRAIALLVANAVTGLDMKNVAILNQRMETVYDGKDIQSKTGLIAKKLDTERTMAKNKEQEIQRQLDAAFGPNSTRVMVDMIIDFDESEVHKITRTPSENPITVEETSEKMAGGAGLVGGASGTASNTPTTVDGPIGGSSSDEYESEQKVKVHLQDEKTELIRPSAGNIKSMTINVLANSAKVTDDKQKDLTSFVDSLIAAKKDDPAFTTNVTFVEFDTTAEEAAKEVAAASSINERIQQALSLLPVLALFIVGFMVMKSIGKVGKMPKVVNVTKDGHVLPIGGAAALGSSGGATGAQQPSQATSSTASQQRMTQAIEAHAGQPEPEPDPNIDPIRNKVNVPLEQIKQMGADRPEIVAMLIKSWLLEDRR